MRRPLIALSLLCALPLAATAVGGTGMPGDSVIVRNECFGVDMDLESAINHRTAPGGSYGSAGPPPPPAVYAPSPASPSKSPKAKPQPTGGKTAGGGKAANMAPPQEEMAYPEAEPAYDDDFSGADAGGASAGQVLSQEVLESVPTGRSYQSAVGLAAGEAGDKEVAGAASNENTYILDGANIDETVAIEAKKSKQQKAKDEKPMDESRQVAQTTARRVMEWGAKIFLSNDDSMSLASAQRVIYALQHNTSLPMEHIRPHELLNYFSFDVGEPSKAQLFDVHASATQDGDQLSVALAVKGATPDAEPLDLTMVIDRSCSMEDDGRMDYTKRGLRKMADQLKRGDRIDLVLFDDTVCTPLENFVVGRDDPKLLQHAIDQMKPEGATDLDLGLKEGYRIAQNHVDTHHRNRRVMVLTDAELNTGDINPHTVTEIGKAFDSQQIRLTGVGVGRTFRDDILDKLTEKGKGAYVFLGSEAVVDRVFGSGFTSLTQTIAHDVQFELALPGSLAMERFYGEEASTVAADIQPINYYAGTSQVFLQDLAMKDGKAKASDPVVLTIRYRDAKTGEPDKRVFQTTVGQMMGSDPHNVNKARALMAWTDLLQAQAMGADPCGAPLDTYAGRAGRLAEDAEIAFVNSLVIDRCGPLPLPTAVAAAPLKVRVDSDQPISHVALACPGITASEDLSGSDTIARFDASPGMCTVTLGGVVDMRVEVEVPATGRDLRCTVRGGRVHCS